MEILVNPEELIACPFNAAHYIQRKRMAFHLVKCKKNHQGKRIVNCDFNANHQIPEIELQYHHENCPDRKDIERVVYQESGSNLNKYPVSNQSVQAEESWDDSNEFSYDPKAYCQNHNVLRKLDVESAAKKKNFRIEERQRIRDRSDLSSTESRSGPSSSTVDTDIKPSKKPIILPEIHQAESPTEHKEDDTKVVSDLLAKIKLSAREAYVPKVGQKKF